MNSVGVAPSNTRGEEIANSITHGVGAALAVGGLVVMVAFASLTGDPWQEFTRQYSVNKSIFWAILHCFLSWFYVIYYLIAK